MDAPLPRQAEAEPAGYAPCPPATGTPLRDGDIDRATYWARKAFSADRKSVNTLSMVTDELHHEACRLYGDDSATNALNDVITSFYTSISER